MTLTDFPQEAYVLYAVTIATGPAVKIGAIQAQRLSPGAKKIILGANSETSPTFAATVQEDPRIGLTTLDIKGLLDLSGLAVTTIPIGADALNCWFAKLDETGIASGSSHIKATIAKGAIVPGTLTMTAGEPARMDAEIIALDPGDGTDPIVITAGVALPAVTVTQLGVTDVFTLGPAYLNGGLMDGTLQQVTVDPGIPVQLIRGGGKVAPVALASGQQRFRIRGRTMDGRMISDIKLRGLAITDTTRFFAQKMVQGSSVTAWTGAGNEVHIKFEVSEGTIDIEDVATQHAQAAGIPFTVTPTRKDEGAPAPPYVLLDTTSFIDAV